MCYKSTLSKCLNGILLYRYSSIHCFQGLHHVLSDNVDLSHLIDRLEQRGTFIVIFVDASRQSQCTSDTKAIDLTSLVRRMKCLGLEVDDVIPFDSLWSVVGARSGLKSQQFSVGIFSKVENVRAKVGHFHKAATFHEIENGKSLVWNWTQGNPNPNPKLKS
jgi:hypothetical protein